MFVPTNYVPLKIINLQGEIYQLVHKENDQPIFQGKWDECSQLLKNLLLEELRKILLDGLTRH